MRIALLMLCLFVSACSKTQDYHYFMTHPSRIEAVYNDCKQMTSPECVAVVKAAHDVAYIAQQARQNGQQFGMKILKHQIRIAALQAAQKSQKDNLERSDLSAKQKQVLQKELQQTNEKLVKVQKRVQYMLAVIEIVE